MTSTTIALRRRKSARRKRELTAWMFMAPSLLLLGVFVLWPMLRSAQLSFTNFNLLTQPTWVGLRNYLEILQDPEVATSLRNTFLYTVVVTPVTVILALALAIFLNQKIALRGLTRTAVFLPYIVSLGVISYAFTFLLDPTIGLISYWLSKIGIVTDQSWLSDPNLAMPAVMAVGVWKGVGFYMIMYLAGLQSIPKELNEAALLDGAGTWKRFCAVTWPLLSNQTMLISIMAAIGTIQAFDQIYVMTQGGPFFKTETIVMTIYRLGFGKLEFGYAAAISWLLLGIVLVLSLLQSTYFRKRTVQY